MKVALVHDFLVKLGGAERVLDGLCKMFPEAPVCTLFYDKDKCSCVFPYERIKWSSVHRYYEFL